MKNKTEEERWRGQREKQKQLRRRKARATKYSCRREQRVARTGRVEPQKGTMRCAYQLDVLDNTECGWRRGRDTGRLSLTRYLEEQVRDAIRDIRVATCDAVSGCTVKVGEELHYSAIDARLVALTVIDICALFSVPGYLADTSGMSAHSLWKPYFAMWRLSILLTPAAITCLFLGSGASVTFGEVLIYDNIFDVLQVQSGNPFAARNGFVATNLTVAYIKVREVPQDPNWAGTRVTKIENATADSGDATTTTVTQKMMYSAWQYFESENPSVQGYKKKHPPDTVAYFIAAPIFTESAPCLRRFEATTVCMSQNHIIGWAVQERDSFCSSLGMVACWKEELEIVPMYGCVEDGGLCGRVVKKPTTYLREEIVNLFHSYGWVFASGTPEEAQTGVLRNGSDINPVLWVDVNDDPCILNLESCTKKWDRIGLVGLILSAVTILLIVATAAYDVHVDNQLRPALEYAY